MKVLPRSWCKTRTNTETTQDYINTDRTKSNLQREVQNSLDVCGCVCILSIFQWLWIKDVHTIRYSPVIKLFFEECMHRQTETYSHISVLPSRVCSGPCLLGSTTHNSLMAVGQFICHQWKKHVWCCEIRCYFTNTQSSNVSRCSRYSKVTTHLYFKCGLTN